MAMGAAMLYLAVRSLLGIELTGSSVVVTVWVG